ncbi:MAG: TerB family tellurite resistance protein [Cystobacterineae bacterium]|nr:TerB family tellurite resistance protein [Cystobacterineae bacterium]
MLGKWLGVLAGFLVGILLMPWPWFLVSAILGLLLGHAWDMHIQPVEIPSETPQTQQELLGEHFEAAPSGHHLRAHAPLSQKNPKAPSFSAELNLDTPSKEELYESRMARLLCPILIHVAMADGPVNQKEIRHIRLYFEENLGFSEWGLSAVRAELKVCLQKTAEMNALLSKARPEIPPAMRPGFVSTLYALAMADGELQRAERELLQRIVKYLNLSDEQLQSITSTFFGDGSEHYKALELEPHASDEDIKTAYRKLAATYHPDSNVGMSPKQLQKATETFHQIKEAYEALKKIRGF